MRTVELSQLESKDRIIGLEMVVPTAKGARVRIQGQGKRAPLADGRLQFIEPVDVVLLALAERREGLAVDFLMAPHAEQ